MWGVVWRPLSPIVRYLNATSDLLTSVKKTEDSLSKLKRSRRSTVAAAGPAAGVTDDNKIRLQIALDVEAYAEQVKADGIVNRQWLHVYCGQLVGFLLLWQPLSV